MNAPTRPLIIGCGILRRELQWLEQHRGLTFDAELLGPALHLDLPKLERVFGAQLERTAPRSPGVFFGACHPGLDTWLATRGTPRTRALNCVEMLLGPERYEAELTAGAYFLLEPWARTWTQALATTFGDRPELVREIFRGAHTRVLALRTPCSGDFTAAATTASEATGLPLEWLDVDLGHLERVVRGLLAEVGA